MLIGGIVAGLVTGLLAGGHLANLAAVRLRWIGVLFLAVVIRFATEWALNAGIPFAETLRLPLFASSFGLLLGGLWVNRHQPGLSLAFVGILLNAIAVVVNGGHMPIWRPSLVAAGFDPSTILSPFHVILANSTLNARLPPPRRAHRRHHPDPAPAHPQRRLDRRPVPDRRPRLLPVRDGPALARAGTGGGRATARRAATPAAWPGPPWSAAGSRRPTWAGASAPRPASRPAWPRRRRSTRRSSSAAAARACRPRARRRPSPSRPVWTVEEAGGRRRRHLPGAARRCRRTAPAPSVRPPRPQPVLLGALGGPADQPVRRPGPPDRAGVPRPRGHPLAGRRRPSCSSPRPCRTSSSRRSPARTSTAGTRRTSWSSATCCGPRSS